MTTLQLSPIGGVPATAAGASPPGEAASSPNSKSASQPGPDASTVVIAPNKAAVAAQAAHATAASQAAAQQAAEAATAQAALRVETPPLHLSIGIIGGTFDVYVDLTDPVDNRVVARLYGPKGSTTQAHSAPAKVRTEA